MEKKTILEKVDFILRTVIDHSINPEKISVILDYTKEHSDNLVLGRVFGWSVSDYAIAALKWLNTEETNVAFDRIFSELSDQRKNEVNELIERKIYTQY